MPMYNSLSYFLQMNV